MVSVAKGCLISLKPPGASSSSSSSSLSNTVLILFFLGRDSPKPLKRVSSVNHVVNKKLNYWILMDLISNPFGLYKSSTFFGTKSLLGKHGLSTDQVCGEWLFPDGALLEWRVGGGGVARPSSRLAVLGGSCPSGGLFLNGAIRPPEMETAT